MESVKQKWTIERDDDDVTLKSMGGTLKREWEWRKESEEKGNMQ